MKHFPRWVRFYSGPLALLLEVLRNLHAVREAIPAPASIGWLILLACAICLYVWALLTDRVGSSVLNGPARPRYSAVWGLIAATLGAAVIGTSGLYAANSMHLVSPTDTSSLPDESTTNACRTASTLQDLYACLNQHLLNQ